MDRVVIGEAVELDVRIARLPSRALAFAIDLVIVAALLVAVVVAMAAAGDELDTALAAAVSLIVTVGVLVGYPLLWETLTRGRSPGKYAMGLRVVRTDGGAIVFRHALARALAGLLVDFGLLSLGTGLIGIVVSASSRRGQRVGDLLAGTVVVRERLPQAGLPALPPADPALAAWATGCELAGLSDDLALAGRQFLVRAPQLATSTRAALAERLAHDVAARVAPPPPPGVPAEAYLLAVLGERRRRESLQGEGTPPAPPAPPPGRPPTSWARPWGRTEAAAAPDPARSTGGFAPPG